MSARELADEMDEAASLPARLEREREDAKRKADIRELRRLLKAENHRQESLAILRDLVPLVEPPKLSPAPKPPRKAPRHTQCLVTSDWQMGQHSKLGASGGIYTQTTDITKRQIRRMWELVEIRHRLESAAKLIEELVIFDLGDLVEGDQMRPSQAAEVDAPVTRQAVDVLDLSSWLIQQALTLYPKVRWLKVGGNHDRTSTKPGNAGLGELGYTDTYSWFVGEVLKRMFAQAIDSGRLEIVNHESFFGTADVAGMRCVYEHGASFKSSAGSYGGVSFYSIANAARGYKEMLDGADMVLMGHHHKAMVLPMNGGWGWQVMNGALPPSSSWIQSSFKSIGRPTQLMLDIHHEVGLTQWAPLYLEQPEHMRPGNFWKKSA